MFRWSNTCLMLMAVVLPALAGCADGPFNGGGTFNPWLRREWEKDERRGPTFHTQMQQLKELADSAGYEPADRQEQIAQEMMERYRNEPNPLLRGAVIKVVGYVNGSVVDETLTAAM